MELHRFLLVHSPIVGPDTWEPVADELRRRGHDVVVPILTDDGSSPFWRQHTRAVARAVKEGSRDGRPLTVVAHSGAGQLTGHVGAALRKDGHAVDAYVLVDAGTPTGGCGRLEQLRLEEPRYAEELESLFEAGERFPDWSEELLSGLVPDASRRQKLMSGVRQLPVEFWEEPIPRLPAWPDAPCGVLLLSDAYEATAVIALEQGWPVRHLDVGNHFFMLVEPETVARELTGMREALVAGGPEHRTAAAST